MKDIFSKSDKQIIKISPLFKFVGLFIVLLGALGILIGLHKLYIVNTTTSRNYDKILTFISIGIVGCGYLIYGAYRIIEKFKKIEDKDKTD